MQRHRSLGAAHHRGVPAGPPAQVLGEEADVAERGRHQQELRGGQFQQRHLPGPAAVGVAVVVELIHHHQAHLGGRAEPQREVGQHLRGAADDRCVGFTLASPVSMPTRCGAEDVAEGEELLAHQRLDRGGVEAAPAGDQGGQVRAGGHQRLAGAGRRGQDDVAAGDASRSAPRPGAGRAAGRVRRPSRRTPRTARPGRASSCRPRQLAAASSPVTAAGSASGSSVTVPSALRLTW